MTKISKKKLDLRKKQKVEAAKLGIRFYPGVSNHVKQAILEGEKELREGKGIQTTHEELVRLVRSL